MEGGFKFVGLHLKTLPFLEPMVIKFAFLIEIFNLIPNLTLFLNKNHSASTAFNNKKNIYNNEQHTKLWVEFLEKSL